MIKEIEVANYLLTIKVFGWSDRLNNTIKYINNLRKDVRWNEELENLFKKLNYMESQITKDGTQILDLDNLTPEQALQVQAKILGYKRMPVSIEQFIEDPYYLGSMWGGGRLYPYWLSILKKIYPTPIHTAYPYVIFTGQVYKGPYMQ